MSEITKEKPNIIKTVSHRELSLKFLDEYPNNFLLTPAPVLPSLLCDELNNIFIPRGIVASLIGAGGVGKTHWCTQLAFSVALGCKFLEKYTSKKAGNVALIVGENSQDDIHRVLQKTVTGFFGHYKTPESDQALLEVSKRFLVSSVTGLDASFVDRNGTPSPFYKQLLEQLITKEPETGWDLIILDPASRFLGPNAEIDNAAATAFIALLENIIQSLRGKPTILFAHHMSKNAISSQDTDATASRGASGLTDGVRLQINLERVKESKDQIKMKVTKTNHTAMPEEEIISKDFNGHLSIKTKDTLPDIQTQQANDKNKQNVTLDRKVLAKQKYGRAFVELGL